MACLTTLGLRKIDRGQTTLLAALIVGAFLGPSLLGRVAPDLHDTLRADGPEQARMVQKERAERNARHWLEQQRALNTTAPEVRSEPTEEHPKSGTSRSVVHWLIAAGCLAVLGVGC